jgi:cold-inducible RNA-binding protein
VYGSSKINPASSNVLINYFWRNYIMNKIYIGNLPYQATEQDVQTLFAQFGDIENVAIIKDRDTGRPKGFGFVTFAAQNSAQDALKMDGQDFQGRPIKVSMAKEKAAGEGSNGGRRAGGSNGGGGSRRRW